MSSPHAFMAFLRVEANQAEERARQLRATAAAIEANSFTTDTPRKNKRKTKDPNKPKRQATAYTLFVSENYEHIKQTHNATMPGKDIISMIARQWAATSEEEKQLWKERANAIANAEHAESDAAALEGVAFVETDPLEEEQGKKKKAATKHIKPAAV